MAKFEGFPDADAKFFRALAKHNDREWFLAHKDEFREGYEAPMKLLLGQVRAAIDGAFPHVDLGEPKVFRIFRDVRFSRDKSPYKTHLGGYVPVARSGSKVTDLPMALYFHFGAEGAFAAAGHYQMEPASLARFRARVADAEGGRELERILAALKKKGYEPGAAEALKRVPKGFDPEHPRSELLKYKGLFAKFPDVPRELLTTSKLPAWLATGCKATAPLVQWLAFATA